MKQRSCKLFLEMLEGRIVPTTILLHNLTGLTAEVGSVWVAGFNGGGELQPSNTKGMGTFGASTQQFYRVGTAHNEIESISLTSGSGRLIFVVSKKRPSEMTPGQGSFTPAPYNPQSPPAAKNLPTGPQDFFEFAYNGNDDLTAVQGFGLNMSFTDPSIDNGRTYGISSGITRKQIGSAYSTFMKNDPEGADFAELLYHANGSKTLRSEINVPEKQFLEITDPNDWIVTNSTDPLVHYWDTTLANFFQTGNYLSINVGTSASPNIYSGECIDGTYSLSNGTNTYQFQNPGTGMAGAKYVFGQAFSTAPAADQGLLQDNIWEALCRGVALDGVSVTPITGGESTTAWNNTSVWYTQHTSTAFPNFTAVYDTYAKFLHYSTVNGTDSRAGGTPIFSGNSAYGFSEDENPNGLYTGGQVPSKTIAYVGPSDTVKISIGRWS